MSVFSRLLRQSGVYALGNIAIKASGIVLAPIYLNVLTESAYADFALLDVTGRFAVMVAGLGLATGLLRFMTREADGTDVDREAVPFTALVVALGAAGVLFAALWGGAEAIAEGLLTGPAEAPLVRLLAAYAAFKVVEGLPMMLLRTQERAGLYSTALLAEMVVLVGAVVWFVVELDRGLRGVMEAYALSAGVGTVVLVGAMVATAPRRFAPGLVVRLVRFGAPLVLAGLASLFMNLGDRYLLRALAPAEALAAYDWSARLGGLLLMLFVNSFQLAFGVIGLKSLEDRDGAREVYRRTFRHYVIWTGWGVLGLSLLALDLTDLVSDKATYFAAETLVLPIAAGYLAYGLYYIVVNVLYASGRTQAIAWTVGAAALANAALNVVLIPVFGALGAGLATAAAYALLLALTTRRAARLLPVAYSWSTLAVVAVLVGALYALGHTTADWAPVPRLAARIGVIGLYLPLLLVTRLYTPGELRHGWAWLAAWRAQGSGAGSAANPPPGGA